MLVRVLGTIQARPDPDGRWVSVSGQQRVVMALLVADLGSACRPDRVVQALWGERAPPHAHRLIQSQVSRLRRVLEPDEGRGSRLRAVSEGWLLDVAPDRVDAGRLDQLVDEAADLAGGGRPAAARGRLEEAVALWRGRPFAELADHALLGAAAARLHEKYLAGWQQLLRLRLDAGEPDGVVADAHQLVAAHPLRERLWALLMEAQCRAGQPADALAAYQQLREQLADELGTEPSGELQRLHTAILRHQVAAPANPHLATGSPPDAQGRQLTGRWSCRRELPLAGRDQARAALDHAFAQARQSRPQLALVAGEPGIGKTRLIADFADVAAAEGADVLAGRCSEGAGVPYQPIVEALTADVAATADAALAARLGPEVGELTRLVPSLAVRTGWQPAPASVSAELDQHRLFTAVAGWLAAAAAQAPLVLVVEDLHAATRPTWLMLDHVVRTAGSARWLVIVTYRDTADQLPDELADLLADWVRCPDVTSVSLAGLDRAAVAELLPAESKSVTGAADWAGALQAATGGNPLFIEELLAALAADPPASPAQLTTQLAAPDRASQLVAARLRRLAPATVAWLDQAAVAGERFDFTQVTDASDLTDDQALDAVDEATAARLITPTSTDDTYAFTHQVTRHALLARLTPSRRMRLHARLATALETRCADDPTRVAGRLAHHHHAAGAAGDPAKARHYALAAGDQAMTLRAYDDAAAHYHHALQLVGAADDPLQRCDVLLRLGEAQSRAGDPAHRPTLLQAGRLALELGDPPRIARAAFAGSRGFLSQLAGTDDERVGLLQDALAVVSDAHPGPRAVLLALLAHELVFGADLTRRRRLADDALALARHHDEPVVLAQVLALRWVAIQHPATLADRVAETDELAHLAGDLDDLFVQTIAHTSRFVNRLEAGDRTRADAAADQALHGAHQLAHPVLQAFVSSIDVARELLWGELDHAEHLADRYRAQGQEAGAADIDCPYLAQQFLLHRERGQLTAYRPLLDRALAAYGMAPTWQALAAAVWSHTGEDARARAMLDCYAAHGFDRVPHDAWWAHTLCLFADVAARTEHRQGAAELFELLAPYADRVVIEVSVPLGAMAHYLGLLAITTERWLQAEGYLDDAADLHHELGAHRWHTRTLLARARLHLARNEPNDHHEAIRLLDTVTARARQHGHTGLLCEAHELVASADQTDPSYAPSSTAS